MTKQHGNDQRVQPNEKPRNPARPKGTNRAIKSRFGVLGILGTVVAVIGVLIAWQQLQRAQRLFAITEIVAKWNDNTSQLKNIIEAEYNGIYNERFSDLLSAQKAKTLYEATESTNEALYKVRQSVVELLNYFEYIALACENAVADEKIVKSFAGAPMMRWNKALAKFIAIYNEDRKSCVWGPYYVLMEKWDEPKIPCG